jgi:hypothetical protein
MEELGPPAMAIKPTPPQTPRLNVLSAVKAKLFRKERANSSSIGSPAERAQSPSISPAATSAQLPQAQSLAPKSSVLQSASSTSSASLLSPQSLSPLPTTSPQAKEKLEGKDSVKVGKDEASQSPTTQQSPVQMRSRGYAKLVAENKRTTNFFNQVHEKFGLKLNPSRPPLQATMSEPILNVTPSEPVENKRYSRVLAMKVAFEAITQQPPPVPQRKKPNRPLPAVPTKGKP